MILLLFFYLALLKCGSQRKYNSNYFLRIKVVCGIIFAVFTFCLIVSGERQDTEVDLKVFVLLACWSNALICFLKKYKIVTVIQFSLIGFGYWFGCHFLTYPLFATAKLITALTMFIIESCFIEPSKISFLYYMLAGSLSLDDNGGWK